MNTINKIKMIALLIFLVLLPSIMGFAAPKVYKLDISKEGEALKLLSKEIGYSRISNPSSSLTDAYKLELTSREGIPILSFDFEFPEFLMTVTTDETKQDTLTGSGAKTYVIEEVATKSTIKRLIVPYFSTAKAINIYDPKGQLVLSTDVSQYSSNCEYRMCSLVEIQDNLPANKSNLSAVLISITVGLIIVLGGLLNMHRRKKIKQVYYQINNR